MPTLAVHGYFAVVASLATRHASTGHDLTIPAVLFLLLAAVSHLALRSGSRSDRWDLTTLPGLLAGTAASLALPVVPVAVLFGLAGAFLAVGAWPLLVRRSVCVRVSAWLLAQTVIATLMATPRG